MLIRTPFLPLFLQNGLGALRTVMDFSGGVPVKEQGPRSVVRFSLSQAGGKRNFFLKRHRHPPLGEQVREFLRWGRILSGGRREWENLWSLRQLGIATVEPVGFGERRRWGWEMESFLITEELEGACRLTDFIPLRFPLPLPSSLIAQKRRLMNRLASLTHRMHEEGFFHRDLYLGHFFIKSEEARDFELYLMDLGRLIQPRGRRKRWIIKDLASLNFSAPGRWFSASDRLRFFKQYRQISRLDRRDKSLICRVIRKSGKIRAHTGKLLKRGKIPNAPWGWEEDAA